MSMHEIYCCFLRDAISKGLYAQLFSWLVSRINQICFKEQKDSSIALLDIYGFEVRYFRIRKTINFAFRHLGGGRGRTNPLGTVKPRVTPVVI